MLNNGRKCTYNFQCKSRNCDEDTKACKGREKGDSCNDHSLCDRGYACRSSIIWPYETQCLPMGDVNSRCETDYDCKPRNFCWRKLNLNYKKDSNNENNLYTPKICLEKHVSPDNTKFWWDIDQFPEKHFNSKEAIYRHGSYCKSGLAYHSEDKVYGHVAVCISINEIQVK